MTEPFFNVGLESSRRQMGGGSIANVVSEDTSLVRSRAYGSSSALTHGISQTEPLIHGRSLYGDHAAIWSSGVYVRFDLPATPIIVQDRADPSQYVFRVTNAGAGTFKGGITAASIDIPSVGGAGFHVDTSANVGTGGTTATDAASPFLLTSTGMLSARTVNVYPKDDTSKALVVTNDKGTSANLTEWNDGSGVATRVAATGAFGSARSLSLYNALTDTQPTATLSSSSPGELQLGTGGSTALDVFLRRIAAKILQLGGAINASGNAIELNSMTAPAVASSTEGVRIYDEAGVLKWKNHAGTAYDLSAASTTTVATDTLWDALGDTAYGSGADTGAKLAGNTAATRKFLRQLGTGSVSAAPAWDTIADADVPSVHSGTAHHAQSHTLTSHSTRAHSELTSVGTDDHHAQAHTLTSHSTRAHSELTSIGTDDHHAQAHGAADHTDITRSIFLRAGDLSTYGGTVATVGTTPNIATVIQLPTGATQGFGYTFRVPDDWVSGAVNYVLYYEGSTGETGKVIDFRRTYLDITDGMSNLIDATGQSNTHATASANLTAKQPYATTSAAVVLSADVVAGHIYRVVHRRFTGGTDTYGGTIEVIGVVISYTANQ